MKANIFIVMILLLGLSVGGFSQNVNSASQPNILLVTVDDMNWNSPGVFGSSIEEITPNIDALAQEGIRFERAYVTAANCSPSRVSIQTGLYPHQTGARGFYYIDDTKYETIATLLKKNGYYTGILNKSSDTNPSPAKEKYWHSVAGFKKVQKYDARAYREKSNAFYGKAKQAKKPFYFVVNIADPHKPFFNDQSSQKNGFDENRPSRIIDASEVSVPGFLPDIAGVRSDVRNYQNSVKRADDCLGAVLASLKKNKLDKNTLVIFLSDHGMPFPFAKSCVYDNGLRTPLIMKWDGHLESGKVIREKLVSSIDLMPTLLDLVGEEMPEGPAYQGRSLMGLIQGEQDEEAAEYVFGNFDENARGIPRPMRGAISLKWNYVFNAWATGTHEFRSATMNHKAYKSMKKFSEQDDAVKQRVDMLINRTVEELYDLEADPNCLHNLATDEAYQEVLEEMRQALRKHMVETRDYLLPAFDVRFDKKQLDEWMETEHAAAETRAAMLKWKRGQNLAGPTKSNTLLYQANN
jgi:N-sulfoglucosamine sulfohydrolase